MKNPIRFIIVAAGVAAAALAARAAEPGKTETRDLRVLNAPDDARPGAKGERHFFARGAGEGVEKEKVTFLGVETSPASPTLTAQLGLQKGVGLVVNHVVPESAAAGVLQQHDILLKLDDQWLIETRQLAVLVRNHNEGDEVTLTYIRAGKQATAKVKLTKHEVPKSLGLFTAPLPPGDAAFGIDPGENKVFFTNPGGDRAEVDRLLKVMPRPLDGESVRIQFERRDDPGFSAMSLSSANSKIAYSDDDGSLELTTKDGKKSLVAKNPKGGEIFSGPVDTPEERKALPDDVGARLHKLEAMHGVSFHTDGDFKGAELKVVHPEARGIHYVPAEPFPTAGRPTNAF